MPKVHRCLWPACRKPKTATKFPEQQQFNMERLTQSKTTRTRLQILLEKHCQTITLPPTCLTVGMKLFLWKTVFGFCQVKQVVPRLVDCSGAVETLKQLYVCAAVHIENSTRVTNRVPFRLWPLLEWFKIACACKHVQMINFHSIMVKFCN